MANQVFKSPLDASNNWQNDLAERAAKNPAYSKMAQYARGDNQDVADDYFYAFKDAYEQSPAYARSQLMMEDDIGSRLSDRYYKLLDDDYEANGITPDGSYESDLKYERNYQPAFEKRYGTHDDFVKRTTEAWKRWMAENYGGHSEDHQSFGGFIRQNPDKFKTRKEFDDYYEGWAGPGADSYRDLYDFWLKKLGL